jgi:hypothetical protein
MRVFDLNHCAEPVTGPLAATRSSDAWFSPGRRAGIEFALTQSLTPSVGRGGAYFYQVSNNSLYLVSAWAAVGRPLMYNA